MIANAPTSETVGIVDQNGVPHLMMFKTGKSKRPTVKVRLEHVLDVLDVLDKSDETRPVDQQRT